MTVREALLAAGIPYMRSASLGQRRQQMSANLCSGVREQMKESDARNVNR